MTARIDRPRIRNTWSTPPQTRRNTVEDFWAQVDKTSDPDGCWLWTGSIKRTGYGQMRLAGRRIITHRFAYELVVGPIPEGLQIDHLCRVRSCCNPAHLEPVTLKQNVLRGVGTSAENARKTACDQGHPLDEQNTYFDGRGRVCLTCRRKREREAKAARKAQIAADPSLAPHGVLTTYSNWACRCDKCKTAWSEYMREYHQRRKATRGVRPAETAA